MKILIAGALGHIGSRLVNFVLEETDFSVLAVDNLETQRYCSLIYVTPSTRFKFLELDVLKSQTEICLRGIDVVVNLAALTNPEQSFLEPELTLKNNLEIVQKLAQSCIKFDVPLIHISSTSIFSGKTAVIKDSNADSFINPHTPYAKSKRTEELYLQKLGKESQIKFCVLRFGTIYGYSAGMRFHTAVNKFCWQVLTDQKVTIWETALEQTRPYLCLTDGVRSIVHVIENKLYNNETFNIVTENLKVIDVLQVFEQIGFNLKTSIMRSDSMTSSSFTVLPEKIYCSGFEFKGDVKRGIDEILLKFKSLIFEK